MKYNYIYNSKRLQHSLSTTCAQWCIYYIWRKCQGWSLRNILKPFESKDFLINDHMLNLVVNNNFKINRKVIDKEFVKIQIARKTAEKTCIHNFLLLASLQRINYIFIRMNMGKCMTEDTP